MGKKTKKNKKRITFNPYANINWDKASKLFRNIPKISNVKHNYPSVKELLPIIAAAGIIGMIFIFPGAAPLLGTFVLGKKSFTRTRTKHMLNQIAKQKYVTIKDKDDGTVVVKITKNGRIKALNYQLNTMKIKRPVRWDKKWRVVIFDIPEEFKKIRDIFRMRLIQLGLYHLQDSVFISPYRCFNEIEFLRELYDISFTVRYLLVEKVEDDELLKQHFHIK